MWLTSWNRVLVEKLNLSVSQEIPLLLWRSRVHFRVHKSPFVSCSVNMHNFLGHIWIWASPTWSCAFNNVRTNFKLIVVKYICLFHRKRYDNIINNTHFPNLFLWFFMSLALVFIYFRGYIYSRNVQHKGITNSSLFYVKYAPFIKKKCSNESYKSYLAA